MNRQTRIEKIKEVLRGEHSTAEELMWQDSLQPMRVYKVPLNCLIYNKYNGRILSRTKSLESQGEEINPETEEGKKIIEKLLWDSRPDRNQKTKKDIEKYTQKRPGIITKDGIVIDGNRRVMLLNQIEKFDYFKAMVLPVTLDENPIEIQKLETSYQMGEDEKLGYRAIEKYLKAKTLLQQQVTVEQIANWMGETVGQVEEYLSVMKTMEGYLDYLGYNEVFTQLDDREDLFINLAKWTRTFRNTKRSVKAFDGYKDDDVDDLEIIAFNYIRAKYEGKDFRLLGNGNRESHFFGDKQIWTSFRDAHFDKIQPIQASEEEIDFASPNIQATLNARDEAFRKNAETILRENLKEHEQKLYHREHKNEPDKLVTKAIDAVEVARINQNIANPETLDKVQQLHESTTSILRKNSPKLLLGQIMNLLSSIELEGHANEKEDLLRQAKDIQKEAYQLEKQIKDLE